MWGVTGCELVGVFWYCMVCYRSMYRRFITGCEFEGVNMGVW